MAAGGAGLAQAQEPASAEQAEPAPAEQAEPAPVDPAAAQAVEGAARADGPRFRGGVAFTGGAELVPEADFTAGMYGVDGRLGVQINHLLGVYAALHLSFGSGQTGFGGSGMTGTFGGLLMADVTFLDALFVGAGAGYAVFNNPGGAAIGLRAGGYPLKSAPQNSARRKGLMVSLETRIVLLEAPYDIGYQVMAAVGYEAF